MKSSLLFLGILISLFATLITRSQTSEDSANALTSEKEAKLPCLIRTQVEFIEMPIATYTQLMAKPSDSSDDTALRAQCAQLIKAGEAQIIETMCLTSLPNQQATVESIAEYIYPTEYEPGELPNKVNGQTPTGKSPIGSPPTPSAFDTKNLGSTLEVEAKINSDHDLIDLRFSPTLVYLTKLVNWGAEKISGAAGPVRIPSFYVLTTETPVILTPGQPTMVAALSPQNDEGFTDSSRKIMLFVRADVLSTGK